MNLEAIKNMPPSAALAVAVVLLGGGGSLGVTTVTQRLDSIEQQQIKIVRKLDSFEWKIDRNQDRLNGQATKNREQDASILTMDRLLTRLDAMSKRSYP